MNIHFICRGNVLRSLIAETYAKSLKKDGLRIVSSGTNVNWSDEKEKEYFANTIAVLTRHHTVDFAKVHPDQLTQERANDQEVTILMNQRVVDEAKSLVTFTGSVVYWDITDIGEGFRSDRSQRTSYEEEIYAEITANVDTLLQTYFTIT